MKYFENKKPQINADERRFVIAYICDRNIVTPKDFTRARNKSF